MCVRGWKPQSAVVRALLCKPRARWRVLSPKMKCVRYGINSACDRCSSALTHALPNLRRKRLICIRPTRRQALACRNARARLRIAKKSLSWAVVRTASGRVSNLTIAAFTHALLWQMLVMRRSWSTVTRKPCRPIMIRRIACISNR